MLSKGEHDRVCYGGIGVLGELLLLLLGKEELTTPDMLLTNNWTWLGQHQVDKDYWALLTFFTLGRYETRNSPTIQ